MDINDTCPFCRTPKSENDAETLALVQARVEKNDPEATKNLGDQYLQGELGLKKDMSRTIELWTEAAELGSADAYYHLGLYYKAKGVRFYEKAAMLGHSMARHNLGGYEYDCGNYDRAFRHLLISAKMGYTVSLKTIKKMFTQGFATKTQYEEALKGYQDAMEEMESPQREDF